MKASVTMVMTVVRSVLLRPVHRLAEIGEALERRASAPMDSACLAKSTGKGCFDAAIADQVVEARRAFGVLQAVDDAIAAIVADDRG